MTVSPYTGDMTKIDGYYTTEEAAEELGIKPVTVRWHISEGNVKAVKIGKAWLIPEDELNKIRDLKPGRPPSSEN